MRLFENANLLYRNRIYLSVIQEGTEVDLWRTDDSQGRQRWILEHVRKDDNNENNIYYIKVSHGTDDDRTYLSVMSDGINIELIDGDQGLNETQEWILKQEINEEWFYIYTNAALSTNNMYLSAQSSDSLIILTQSDDGSGRQRWILEPIGQGYVQSVAIII